MIMKKIISLLLGALLLLGAAAALADETVTITYTLALDDDQTVIWHLTFVENMLQSMNMLLR